MSDIKFSHVEATPIERGILINWRKGAFDFGHATLMMQGNDFEAAFSKQDPFMQALLNHLVGCGWRYKKC